MTHQIHKGRPRSFDETVALAAIMEVFWSNGYAGTRYGDLEAATQLHRQSLIYAFGDKKQMFQKALFLYAERRVNEIVAILRRPGEPLANIKEVFDDWLSDAQGKDNRGCLMVNTAGELGQSDTNVAFAIAQASEKLRVAFSEAFTTAQKRGEINDTLDPVDLAYLAVSAGDGALLHARSSGKAEDAKRAYRALLSVL